MTKFEEIGQKYQMQAYDIDYAKILVIFVAQEVCILTVRIVLLLSLIH